MQCPLLPSPLSCLVRRESCNQTDKALRSSSCYKNSVVSLELVSLRKRKDKASVKVHCSLLCKFTSLCAQLFCSDQDELFPQGTKWNTSLGPHGLSSPPHLYASGTLLYGQTFALENKFVLMLPASTGLLQPLLLADCLSLSLQQRGWTCLLLYTQTPSCILAPHAYLSRNCSLRWLRVGSVWFWSGPPWVLLKYLAVSCVLAR